MQTLPTDIHPDHIDPDTGRPYANYSSPSLDTSFHDHEMDVDDTPRTTDLGNDWFCNQHRDGSMTLRNCEIGQRIDVPAESVDRLRAIIREA